jgi:predicted nucleic acid-binding protein
MNNVNHIFVDTNVLIGTFRNNAEDKYCLQYLFSLQGKRLFISSLSVAQLVSVFQKTKTNAELKKIVASLLAKFNIISFSDKDIVHSLEINRKDMEDNIQYVISQKFNCFYFVTNNRRDYVYFNTINVLKPLNIRTINRD